jgi:predicted transposase/invertase (TIGR01784 family)
MPDIHVHVHFFRSLFSDPDRTRLFLKEVLPPELQADIDLEEMHFSRESHVKPDLRSRFSDLVVRTRMRGRRADIYILMEHKSTPDHAVWLQIMEYQLELWRKERRPGRHLTPIIPLVFYHGKRRWHVPTDFADQFAAPASALPFLPRYRYILFDAGVWEDISPGPLRQNVFLLTGLMLLKHAWNNDPEMIAKIIAFWRDSGYINKQDEVFIQLRYVVETRDITPEALNRIFEETLEDKESIMPTLAERWLEQGKVAGEARGMLREKQRTLLRLMERKFGITDEGRARIQTCTDGERLTAALDAILDAPDAGAVLRLLG